MRNTKICPKCGSSDVMEIPGGHEGGANWLPVGWGSVPIDRFVCCSCGHAEEWIRANKLQKVKDYWMK